jgi:hypothetical protein
MNYKTFYSASTSWSSLGTALRLAGEDKKSWDKKWLFTPTIRPDKVKLCLGMFVLYSDSSLNQMTIFLMEFKFFKFSSPDTYSVIHLSSYWSAKKKDSMPYLL